MTPTQAGSGQERLLSLQMLRAVAALVVMWSHSIIELERISGVDLAAISPILRMGRVGVDVFFVISGFVMVYVSVDGFSRPKETKRFLLRRIARVVPVYWFYTSLVLLIGIIAPKLLRGLDLSPLYVAASYLFIPMQPSDGGEMHPLFGLGWTLNYEMFFYVLFAPLLLLTLNRAMIVLNLIFLSLVFCGLWLEPADGAFWFWTRSIILEFVSGALLAVIFIKGLRHETTSAIVMVGVAIIWLFVMATYWNRGNSDVRFLVTGIPAILIAAAFILTKPSSLDLTTQSITRMFLLLGDASYSLYLVHMFVIRALTLLLPVGILGNLYPYLFLLITFVISAIVAIASYKIIEKPSNQAMRRWLNV